MNIMVKSTGERKTAQYITTPTGNKRLSVDGKTYTDKKFNALFAVLPENGPMMWKSHIRQLFDEILVNKDCWILHQPLRITLTIIGHAAEHAAKMEDDKMIGFFCALAVYKFSDPTDPEYDEERTNFYLNAIQK